MGSKQSSQELLNKLAQARARAESNEPKAIKASYDARSKLVKVVFSNRLMIAFPPEMAQGLAGASSNDLSQIEITPSGQGLRWESLDVDLSVPGLISGVFGTEKWMSQLGKKGGSSTSQAKSEASRVNGKRGGRPRRQPLVVLAKPEKLRRVHDLVENLGEKLHRTERDEVLT